MLRSHSVNVRLSIDYYQFVPSNSSQQLRSWSDSTVSYCRMICDYIHRWINNSSCCYRWQPVFFLFSIFNAVFRPETNTNQFVWYCIIEMHSNKSNSRRREKKCAVWKTHKTCPHNSHDVIRRLLCSRNDSARSFYVYRVSFSVAISRKLIQQEKFSGKKIQRFT